MNSNECASPDKAVEWHDINWADSHSQVRKLQARIVKATQEGRWGKVKSLQWLLTHSFSGKAIVSMSTFFDGLSGLFDQID